MYEQSASGKSEKPKAKASLFQFAAQHSCKLVCTPEDESHTK